MGDDGLHISIEIDARNLRSDDAIKEGEAVSFDVLFHPKGVEEQTTHILVFSNASEEPEKIPIKGILFQFARPTIEVLSTENKAVSGVKVSISPIVTLTP